MWYKAIFPAGTKQRVESALRKTGMLLVIVCCTSLQGFSIGKPRPRVRSFSVAQGLPSSETYFVHQDKQGYIWFCTDRGVVRYDGYRLKLFTEKDGLTDNVVFRIYEDYKGRLWFVSSKSSLCYYENGRIVPYKHNNLVLKAMHGFTIPIKDLYIDRRNGDLTMSAYGVAAFRISESGKFTEVASTWKKGVSEIWERDNEVHFTLVYNYENAGKTNVAPEDCPAIVHHAGGKSTNYGGIEVRFGIRILKHEDAVFFITNNNLYMLRRQRLVRVMNNVPMISLNSEDGYLWVGIYEHGVKKFRVDKKQDVLHEVDHLFNQLSVSYVKKDREGGYWFSTLEDGIKYAPYLEIRHLTRREGMASRNVTSVSGVNGIIFFVCNYRTLQPLDPAYPTLHSYNNYKVLFGNFRDTLLVSGFGAVSVLGPIRFLDKGLSTAQFKRIFANDKYYILSNSGIYRLDKAHRVVTLLKNGDFQPFYRPNVIMTDAKDRVFMGNEMGLFHIENGKIRRSPIGMLEDVRIEDLDYHTVYGSIAVTRGKGLVFFDGGKLTGTLSVKDGLLSDQINFCRVDDRNRLWAGTNKGLNCITKTDTGYLIRQYTIKNGLLTNEVNDLYEYKNRIWVATKKGVTIIDLSRPEPKHGESGLFLEEIQESSRGTIKSKSPVFASGTTFVKIVLRTTCFRSAPFHRFRYRFSTEGEWATAMEPEIVLNNPKHGDYKVEISSLDESGKWSRPKVICSFSIESPFYQTWYFITGLILLGFGVGFLLFRLRIGQLSRRHQLQKRINQLEQKALRAQMNPHFIFNSLNSIQSFLIFEENEKAERYLLKFAHLIRQTLNNSRESYITIEAEMETLKRYLDLEQMRFKDKFRFEVICHLSPEELNYGIPPMLLQPYVENAVLHGFRSVESGGKIEVVFESLKNNRLLCTVEDNGVGMKASGKHRRDGHKSFGTKITAERLEAFREKYGDDFTITTIEKTANGIPAGTKIVIQIPVVSPTEITTADEA